MFVKTNMEMAKKQGKAEGLAEGIEKGIEQGKVMIINKMFENGFDNKTISNLSGMKEEVIQQLRQHHIASHAVADKG